MSLIQKELEKTSGTDDAAIEKIIETEFMTEGKGHLVILPAIREEEAEEEARGHLEGEGMFKRKKIEMVSEINLTFIPLIRMFFSRMSGFISKKRKVYTLFFDAVTGELVTKYRKGLRRTQNISVLFDYPKTQVAVLLVMRRITALSDIELRAKSELRAQDLKSALNSLEKKGMVHRQVSSDGFYKYKRTIDISSPAHLHKATPDMPYIREGRLIVEAVKQRFKPKDVEKLMKGLADDLTLVDHDIVHYPYYIASVEGKRGPRKIFIDGINGGEDELLGTILNLKMEIPK